MKPSVYQCEVCGADVPQNPGTGRLKRFCGKACRNGRYYTAKRTHCTACGGELTRYGALRCVDCRPVSQERKRNPFDHAVYCRCSPECRQHSAGLVREWRKRNPETKRAQDARYRDRHRIELNEKSRARYGTPERREYQRQWALENLEKVQAVARVGYRRNRDQRLAATKAWRAENAEYVRQLQRAWRDDMARVVTPRAINGRTPWTDAELQIALDQNLSLAEAALRLGRTVTAVGGQRHKARRVAS